MNDQTQRLSLNVGARIRRGVWPLVTVEEMQALDRKTIDVRGVPGEVLMESAGRAIMRPVLDLLASSRRPAAPIRIFCGAGNNGGDGFVLARHLFAEGVPSETILLGQPDSLPVDARCNWDRLKLIHADCRSIDPKTEAEDWPLLLSETSVAVDALFGVGLKRSIQGVHARLIEALTEARLQNGLKVLAVDLPSGVDAETGSIRGVAVEADHTVTISLPKIGLAIEPGRSHAGTIQVARIGIADPDPERLPRTELWNARAAAREFPNRPRNGHKGTFGRVLVVAGSKGMLGAGLLCARSCLRAGAGLVTLVHPEGLESETGGLCAEVMTAQAAATEQAAFSLAAAKTIEELAASRRVIAIAIGPGLGRSRETSELVHRLLSAIDLPMVLDADALYALAEDLTVLHGRSEVTILTPHPGEAARLLGIEGSEIASDRVRSARRLAEKAQSTVILKGAATVVADPSGRTLVIPTGGPALASAGTGDVLTGVVTALLAAGRPPFEAAGLAAWWHGATADRLDSNNVGFGLLASAIADGLAACAAEIMSFEGERAADADLVLRFPES